MGNLFIPSNQQQHDGRVIVRSEVITSFESKDKANNTETFTKETLDKVLKANENTCAKVVLVVLNGRKANYADTTIDKIKKWCEEHRFCALYALNKENGIVFQDFEGNTAIQHNLRIMLFAFLHDLFPSSPGKEVHSE